MTASNAVISKQHLLIARDLVKGFDGRSALAGVSLDLREGEVLSIIGPSGSGKTTLLRCLALLDSAESGTIEWPIVDVTWDPTLVRGGMLEKLGNRLHRSVGVVFQGLNLWDTRSVWDNLTLAPRLVLGLNDATLRSRADDLCARLDIVTLMDSWAWQLSGGQRQRVALARALMMQPKALLLDEVTSALDPLLTVQIMHFLRELRAEGMTMIVVSHHVEFAAAMSDRMMFLSGGQVGQIGTPDEVLGHPATDEVAKFVAALREVR
jgi:polar amino acid transport system ATP-binding protein